MPSASPYHVPFLSKILLVRTCGGSAGGTGGIMIRKEADRSREQVGRQAGVEGHVESLKRAREGWVPAAALSWSRAIVGGGAPLPDTMAAPARLS